MDFRRRTTSSQQPLTSSRKTECEDRIQVNVIENHKIQDFNFKTDITVENQLEIEVSIQVKKTSHIAVTIIRQEEETVPPRGKYNLDTKLINVLHT